MSLHLSIKSRIIGGFAIVLLLGAAVGGLAVVKMRGVSVQASDLATKAVPMVKAANQVERSSLLTMYNMRAYGLTFDPKYYDEGMTQLKAVNSALQDCRDLAQKENMDDLRQNAATAQENVDRYSKLVDQTAALAKSVADIRQHMNTVAQTYMDVCAQYLTSQEGQFAQEVKAGATAANLTSRFHKIQIAHEIVDLGNACRVANFKGQADRSGTTIEAALPNFDKIDSLLNELKGVTTDAASFKQIADCRTAGATYKQAMTELAAALAQAAQQDSDRNTVAAVVLAQAQKTAATGIDQTAQVANATMASLNAASVVVLSGLVGMAIIGTIIALVIVAGIVRGLSALVTRLKDIAQGEGDLTQRVDEARKDELGELGKWFNLFVSKIHDVIAEVSDSSREVASAATQIAASSEEMATGMKEQSTQVTQISSAIEEMSQSVVEVAKKSADAAGQAQDAGKKADEGGKVVNLTIDGMNGISQAVSASATSVQELGKRGEQIGQVITVINDIADQTNLLALNAAIEAARAGEHGRGFAVVADEVRKLADRTTKATEEIAGSIKAIQTETSEAVERMKAGTEQVKAGVERATEAGQSLQSIVSGAQSVADMIRSIAAAAEEQSAASEQVSRNVESITAVTKQATEGAAQAASAATQLSGKAEQLQKLVGQFKVSAKAA